MDGFLACISVRMRTCFMPVLQTRGINIDNVINNKKITTVDKLHAHPCSAWHGKSIQIAWREHTVKHLRCPRSIEAKNITLTKKIKIHISYSFRKLFMLPVTIRQGVEFPFCLFIFVNWKKKHSRLQRIIHSIIIMHTELSLLLIINYIIIILHTE